MWASFTLTPEMEEQPFRTITNRYSSELDSVTGRVLQTQAIWMIWSLSAEGKPCSAAHYMSKDKTLRGAMVAHSPSLFIS